MKEENYIYISGQENYPSLDTLNKYVRGDLPEEEMVEIGKIIESDPFLADVLDGFNEVGDVAKVNMAVGRIKDHSQKRLYSKAKKRENLSKRQSRVAPNKYTQLIMATAAAIAILFVTVFVVNRLELNDPTAQLAENVPVESENGLDKVTAENPEPNLIPPVDSAITNEVEESLFSERKSIVKESEETLRTNPAVANAKTEPKSIEADTDLVADLPEPVLTQISSSTVPTNKPKIQEKNIQEEIEVQGNLEKKAQAEKIKAEAAQQENIERKKQIAEADLAQSKRAEKQKKDQEALSMMKLDDEVADTAEYMSKEEVNNIPLRHQGPVLIPLDGRITPSKKKKYKEKVDYLTPEKAPLLTDEQIMMGKYQKNVALAEMMTEADRLYKEGSYQAALNNVYEVLRADPKNVMANYYAGGCYFAMQEYKTATPFLKEVAKVSESRFKNDARWLLAQAHLKRNKFRSAESELKILVEENTKYAEEAAELIEKLNR